MLKIRCLLKPCKKSEETAQATDHTEENENIFRLGSDEDEGPSFAEALGSDPIVVSF